MMVKLISIGLWVTIFMATGAVFAQIPTASEIQRSQELLEEERLLREKIDKIEEKFFIKKIVVKGATVLKIDEIKEIILPYQKHWLTQKDIQQILDLLKAAYKNHGHPQESLKISYEVKKDKTLEIVIQELSH